jgi:hypothetical protein
MRVSRWVYESWGTVLVVVVLVVLPFTGKEKKPRV